MKNKACASSASRVTRHVVTSLLALLELLTAALSTQAPADLVFRPVRPAPADGHVSMRQSPAWRGLLDAPGKPGLKVVATPALAPKHSRWQSSLAVFA